MSSLPRRIQRRAARKSADYEPAAQPTIMLADGGYMTLRPTKGWLKVSAARLQAQGRLSDVQEVGWNAMARRIVGRVRAPSRSDQPGYRKSSWPVPAFTAKGMVTRVEGAVL